MKEYEVKYAVSGNRLELIKKLMEAKFEKIYIEQKYISKDERIRIVYQPRQSDDFIIRTKKIPLGDGGLEEVETVATIEEYEAIRGIPIHKTRYWKTVGDYIYSVDMFHDLELILLEVETTSKELFDKLDLMKDGPNVLDIDFENNCLITDVSNANIFFKVINK